MPTLRDQHINQLKEADVYDVLIIGGGINGAVAAAALSQNGTKVALIEQGDFGGLTSSNSSNLVWGGIKYLESHEYLLVNKLCKSRNFLAKNYPSGVKEIRFLTSISKGFRFPAWFIYLGTLLYWLLGRFKTQGPDYLSLKEIARREPAINVSNLNAGIEYSDCYLFDNDARFVFNFIKKAMSANATAVNYMQAVGSQYEQGQWTTQVLDTQNNQTINILSKVLINACGPMVDSLNQSNGQSTKWHHLFSKGVHLIVEKITPNNKVLAFFADDGRLFFVIPMGSKTCIGTTDNPVEDPNVAVTDEDRDFILRNANELLNLEQPLDRNSIISERSGVRPLAIQATSGVADWVKLSRQHKIEVNGPQAHLSVFGGKLTDCLNVGNEVLDITKELGINADKQPQKWYGEDSLNLKQIFLAEAEKINLQALDQRSTLEDLASRLWRRFGFQAMTLLKKIADNPESAKPVLQCSDYMRCELELIAESEMIVCLDDFLRRRTKIALENRVETIKADPGLNELCQILFADQAQLQYQRFLS